ncbi:hypothetical protein SmJEL517_g03527 [Synchytrium microbalum]|uniref:Cytochrome b5 heme-binding domain-containing protein n=1 Tax=Synchytrium microbalum TaxID=1806994 RepID=A0A507C7X0_9FUNG|nr:uncharacterized protein SmJEL517_g03527 [Synchytrium microbalum]TPX33595.1 hypothetical protein SmJEL517_g03527 [Synchytrium microbalum]
MHASLFYLVAFVLAVCTAIPNPIQPTPFASFNATVTALNLNAVQLYNDNEYSLSFYWTIESKGTATERLHGVLVFTCNVNQQMNYSWAGVGLGCSTMLDCNTMAVMHQINSTPGISPINFHEHTSMAVYGPPAHAETPLLQSVSGGFENNIPATQRLYVEFVIATTPVDGIHSLIDVNAPFTLIYAFNPNSGINYRSERFTYHSPDYRGSVQLSRLVATVDAPIRVSVLGVAPLSQKVAHGVGMMLVWLGLFPFGIYWARYLRSAGPGLWIHISVQCFGYLLLWFFFILIVTAIQLWQRPHAILGIFLVVFATIQVLLGGLNFAGLRNERIAEYRHYIRLSHHIVGPCLVLLAVVQVALGLSTLFPLVEPRGSEYWILYFILLGAWLSIFIVTETYYRLRVVNYDAVPRSNSINDRTDDMANVAAKWVGVCVGFMGSKKAAQNNGFRNAGVHNVQPEGVPFVTNIERQRSDQRNVTRSSNGQPKAAGIGSAIGIGAVATAAVGNSSPYDIEMVESPLMKRKIPKDELRSFTWQNLDEEINTGRGLYVVAAGRWVYDISSWINTHPGGRVILRNVIGTDISNDFFHEAGFDVEAINPDVMVPPQRQRTNPLPQTSADRAAAAAEASSAPPTSSLARFTEMEGLEQLPQLNEEDWTRIRRARKVHVHTKLAVQKLAQFLVGEVTAVRSPRLASSSRVVSSSIRFDPYEYRRYAITQMTPCNNSTTASVIKFRFVRLYPHDSRAEEVLEFQPGECVEIQVNIGGQYVSRYITPIGGTPIAFEAYIKIYSNGVMTKWLQSQKVGDKQVKIRGPFGTPFVPRSLQTTPQYPDVMIFFSAGSGLAPALQCLQSYLLPTIQPLRVIVPYYPQQKDELTLTPGHLVTALAHYNDGWAYGTSLTLKQNGIFPLPVTLPISSSTRFLIINSVHSSNDITSDLFALETLKAAHLAYPHAVQCWHAVSDATNLGRVPDLPTGINAILPGRVTLSRVQDILHIANEPHPLFGAIAINSRRVVVCGPRSYTGHMLDILGEAGIPMTEVSVLPPDRYV